MVDCGIDRAGQHARGRAVATENRIRAGADVAMGYPRFGMLDLLKLLGGLFVGLFRSHAAREVETAFLRQQLVVVKRSAPARLRLRPADRLIFLALSAVPFRARSRGCLQARDAGALASARFPSVLG